MAIKATQILFQEMVTREIASTYGLNEYIAGIISGIILFFILGSEFFLQYRLILRRRAEKGGADK